MSETIESNVLVEPTSGPLDDQSLRDQRHNYWVSVIEGGAFIGGMAFLNAQTLMPDIIHQLGGPVILVALAPSLVMAGFWIGPILTAHWVDGMQRYKPFVCMTGVLQRLPYLFAAIALYLAASGIYPGAALAAVVIAPLLCGITGGMGVTAWHQLTTRCIPENKRASAFALRYIISSFLGVIAGLVTKYLFAHFSLLTAYATLHLITFGLMVVSFAVFVTTREPHLPAPSLHTLTLAQNLALMPRLIISDALFRRYLASRVFRNGNLVITPFLAIYARESLDLPESFLGTLIIASMIGAVFGNLGAARLGDRFGGKLSNQLGLGVYVLLSIWAMVAGTRTEFAAIFFLMGFALYLGEVGASTLMLELLPIRNRATYLAITSIINLPAILLAGWISSAFWEHSHRIASLALVTISSMLISMLLLHPIKEPRRAV